MVRFLGRSEQSWGGMRVQRALEVPARTGCWEHPASSCQPLGPSPPAGVTRAPPAPRVSSARVLEPHSANGTGVPVLGVCLCPILAALGSMRRWSLQRSDPPQPSQLPPVAHGACFPAAAVRCCGAGKSEAGEDPGKDAVCGGGAPPLGTGGGKWASVSLPRSQRGKQLRSPRCHWWPSVLLTEWPRIPPSTWRSAAEATGHVGLTEGPACAAPVEGVIRLVAHQVLGRKFLQ